MNSTFKVKKLKNLNLKNPIMIEGLPGMGSVGKIAVDFIIETLNAKKIYEITSDGFPNCVFVGDDGLTDLPKVEIYHKKVNKKDLFLVSGDLQPIDEKSCYDLCEQLLGVFGKSGGKEVITLGGIGLDQLPKKPKVFCAGTEKRFTQKFIGEGVKSAEGIVGPIIGVSGVLVGLSKTKKMKGVVLLVETLAVNNYLGIKEAKELLMALNKRLNLGLNMGELNKEVKLIEKEINKKINKIILKEEKKKKSEDYVNYIG